MSIGILLYLDLEFLECPLKTLTLILQENAIYFTTRSYLTLTIKQWEHFSEKELLFKNLFQPSV